MGNIFDRLARGLQGQQQQGYDNWNEMVGAAPPEQFGRATYEAVRQTDPQDYYRHTQPGVDGTDPFGALAQGQRSGLAQTLIGELLRRGLGQQDISQGAGLQSLDPNQMTPAQLAALSQWTQQNHPKAFGRVAAQYQQEPNVLESLLGNKALMMAAASLGAQFLSNKR